MAQTTSPTHMYSCGYFRGQMAHCIQPLLSTSQPSSAPREGCHDCEIGDTSGTSIIGVGRRSNLSPVANLASAVGPDGDSMVVSSTDIACTTNNAASWFYVTPASLGVASDGAFMGFQDVAYDAQSDQFIHVLQFENALVMVIWPRASMCQTVR